MSEEEQKKPAAKAKKEKPPAVEDKPFSEFMEGHYVPALETALQEQGIEDLELQFVKGKFPPSLKIAEECPQVKGSWLGGRRQFTVYFPGEDIKGPKFFSWAADGAPVPALLPQPVRTAQIETSGFTDSTIVLAGPSTVKSAPAAFARAIRCPICS